MLSQLLQRIGYDDLKVTEIFQLDNPRFLDDLSPIFGLVFLLKSKPKPSTKESLKTYDKDLFFANKVIRNAVAV
jgi:hypothetical protein